MWIWFIIRFSLEHHKMNRYNNDVILMLWAIAWLIVHIEVKSRSSATLCCPLAWIISRINILKFITIKYWIWHNSDRLENSRCFFEESMRCWMNLCRFSGWIWTDFWIEFHFLLLRFNSINFCAFYAKYCEQALIWDYNL